MNKQTLSLAVLLAMFVGVAPATALDLTNLLANHETDSFKIIHANDLSAMMAQGDVTIFDANPPDVRTKEGVIPGAHLLDSSSHYDVAKELPSNKASKIVFYCHNTH